MVKRLHQLDKQQKILLLEAIASGSVDRKEIHEHTFFAFEYQDCFLGLMIASSPGNEEVSVICIGEARKAKAHLFKDAEPV
jgi:hypothetical protein